MAGMQLVSDFTHAKLKYWKYQRFDREIVLNKKSAGRQSCYNSPCRMHYIMILMGIFHWKIKSFDLLVVLEEKSRDR